MYRIGCYESGDIIGSYTEYDAAVNAVLEFEKEDIENGTYEEGFYGIYNTETEEWEQI